MKGRRAIGLGLFVGLALSTASLVYLSAELYRRDKRGRVGPLAPAQIRWSEPAGPTRSVIVIGDSRVQSIEPKPLTDSYRLGLQSYPGMTSAQIVPVAFTTIARERPHVVIGYFGINDLVAASLAPAREAARIESLLIEQMLRLRDECEAKGIIFRCVAITPPADRFSPRRWLANQGLLDSVRRTNSQLAEKLGPNVWIEPRLPTNRQGELSAAFATDELHLTAEAGAAILAAIETALKTSP